MIAAILLAAAPAGECVRSVHDGDTLTLCSGEKVRLANVDAPELAGSERCRHLRTGPNPSWCDYTLGIASRDALRAYLASGRVEVHPTGKLSYGRLVATVTVNGRDAGAYLVAKGLARWWR